MRGFFFFFFFMFYVYKTLWVHYDRNLARLSAGVLRDIPFSSLFFP